MLVKLGVLMLLLCYFIVKIDSLASPTPSSALSSTSSSLSSVQLVSQVIKLSVNTKKGIDSSNNNQIKSLIDELRYRKQQQPSPPSSLLSSIPIFSSFISQRNKKNTNSIDGTWQLLWTTEKETLFFMKNGLFGCSCEDVLQIINTKDNTISNLINFSNNRSFNVIGSIDTGVDSDGTSDRVNFKFIEAIVSFDRFNVKLPPLGKGYFDNIFVDKEYRISYDIRGDYLICKRM